MPPWKRREQSGPKEGERMEASAPEKGEAVRLSHGEGEGGRE